MTPTSIGANTTRAFVHDTARNRIVLYNGELGETWEWDGLEWDLRATPQTPPASYHQGAVGTGMTMAVWDDARSQGMILGLRSRFFFDDATTWLWDGSRWYPQPASIPPRIFYLMSYDSDRGRAVLFGGYDQATAFNDTWEWDGENWTEQHPLSGSPSFDGNHHQAMAYDSVRQKTFLYTAGGDQWEWDGVDWVHRPSVTPAPVAFPKMAFDSSRGVMVMAGQGGTWEWDGTDWTPRSATTVVFEAMMYDRNRGAVVAIRRSPGTGLEVLEWDGSDWSNRPDSSLPWDPGYIAAFHDPIRGALVFQGGGDDSTYTLDTGGPLDTQAPTVSILSPDDGLITSASSVPVMADISDTSTTTVTSTPTAVSESLPSGGGLVSGDLPLTEGANLLTVTATDDFGNVGGASVNVVRDSIAPEVTVLSPAEGAVIGLSQVDLTVETTDATGVHIVFDGLSFDREEETHQVTGTVMGLPEGGNAIEVTATDAAGNVGSATRNLVVDLSAPVVMITSPANGDCFGPGEDQLNVVATVEDLGETSVSSNPAGVSGSLNPGGGIVNGAVALGEGTNVITVTATDPFGRESTASVMVVLDTTAPNAVINAPSDGSIMRGVVDVQVTVDEPAPGSGVGRVDLWLDGLQVEILESVPFETTIDTGGLGDGPHVLTSYAIDGKGNQSPAASASIVVDNTAPMVQILHPEEGQIVGGLVDFEAQVSDATGGVAEVVMHAGGQAPTTDGSQTFDPPTTGTLVLAQEDTSVRTDGDLVLSITVTDAAGNQESAEVTVETDNSMPSKSLVYPVEGSVVSGIIEIRSEAEDPNLVSLEALVDGQSLASSPTSPLVLQFDTTALLDGTHVFTSIASDAAGNQAACDATVTVDNISALIRPSTVNLRSRQQGGTVEADLRGASAPLLLEPGTTVVLEIPGGSAVPAVGMPASIGGNEPRLVYSFDRGDVVGAVQAGLASGELTPQALASIRITAVDMAGVRHVLEVVNMRIIGGN